MTDRRDAGAAGGAVTRCWRSDGGVGFRDEGSERLAIGAGAEAAKQDQLRRVTG